MFNNKYTTKYNKIIYLLYLDDEIINYKKNILNMKFKLLINNKLSYREYYDIYNKIYFDKIKYYNYINKLL